MPAKIEEWGSSMRTKAALCGIFLVFTVSVAPAFAAERGEPYFTTGSDAAKIAAEVLYDGNAFVSSYGTSKADKNQVLNAVQSYVDAVSDTSATPMVKGSVVNSGKPNEQMKLVLVPADDGFTDEELVVLTAKAGESVQSISSYLCRVLSYDYSVKSVTAKSPQTTAKGSIAGGKAVCQGYANAFAVFAEQAGIKSVKVRGYREGVYHVLNVVEDGFAVDVTYTDSSGDNYIMVPFEDFCKATGFKPVVDFETAFEMKYGPLE